MQVVTLDIPGVIAITPARHGDARGWFCETWRDDAWAAAGIDARFVQDNQSMSASAGVLRGLHFQTPPHAQAKLVRVLRGAVLDVVVDIRHGSATFGRHVAVPLSAENGTQLFVPEGCAHGLITCAPGTEVFYKVSARYAPQHDRGLAWDDPDLAIDWGTGTPILSDKDRAHPRLRDLPAYFHWGGA